MTKIQKLLITFTLLLAITSVIFQKGCKESSDPRDNFNFETDWKPETPQFIQDKIKKKYAKSTANQKAMLQYAYAIWMTLDPNEDLETTLTRLNRALDCTYLREIPYDDVDDLEAAIFFNDDLTRRYLEWNRQLAGRIFQGREESEADCD